MPAAQRALSRPELDRAIVKLRFYHRIGEQKRDRKPLPRTRVDGDSQRKAQAFARLFTPAQLESLCARVIKAKAPFGWSHVRILLREMHSKTRDQLIGEAISRRLSVRALRQLLESRLPRRHARLYHARRAAGPSRRLQDIEALSKKLLDAVTHLDDQRLTDPQRRALQQFVRAAEKLLGHCPALRRRLAPVKAAKA